METIIGWFKSIIGFIFTTILLAFLSGYLIGNYHATKASLEYPGYYSFGNVAGWFILKSAGDEEVEKLKKINYDNLPKTE